jgi:Ca-activated chloride channel homolog
MNKCSDIEIQISEMILGEISQVEQSIVHEHLAACDSCMGFYLSMSETFEQAPAQEESGLTQDQKMNILTAAKKIDSSEKVSAPLKSKKFPWQMVMSVAAALAISGVIVFPATSGSSSSAEATKLAANEAQQMAKKNKLKSDAVSFKVTSSSAPLDAPRQRLIQEDRENVEGKEIPSYYVAEPAMELESLRPVEAQGKRTSVVTVSPSAFASPSVFGDGYVSSGDSALADTNDEAPSTDGDSIVNRAFSDIQILPSAPKTKKAQDDRDVSSSSEVRFNYSNNEGLDLVVEDKKGFSKQKKLVAVRQIAKKEVGRFEEPVEELEEANYKRPSGGESLAVKEKEDSLLQKSKGLKEADEKRKKNLAEKSLVAQKKEEAEQTPADVLFKDMDKRQERRPMQLTVAHQQSTFSIDVDTAGYQIAKSQIANNVAPDPHVLRAEEFINYQSYNYTAPKKETFNIETDCATSPFHRGNQIMRVGIQGRRPGGDIQQQSHFVFIVDTSGSMAADGRLPLVKKVLPMIVSQMKPSDKISLIAGGLRSQLILDKVDARDKDIINKKILSLNAVGATNLETNLIDGYRQVTQNISPGTYNRVILLSDGVANLGEVSAQNILKQLESSREQGVGITVIGMGRGDYNDNFLEQLADKGDGNYVYIDDNAEAQKTFEQNFAATFNTIANNVKIQVDFDPEQVAKYRLLGYENRRLKNEDFRNDKVDAGEVGSGQSVTAIYEMEMTGKKTNKPLAVVNMRYKDVRDNQMKEQSMKVLNTNISGEFAKAPSSLRLAFLAGKYAEVLQRGGNDEGVTIEHLLKYMRPLAAELNSDSKVQEMLQLMIKSK